MTATTIFDGRALADAMIAGVRARLGSTAALCHVVRDPANAAAGSYAARLVDLGARAGITVVDMGYDRVAELPAPSRAPVVFLHPVPPGVDVADLIDTLGPLRDAEGLHPLNAGRLMLGRARIVPPTARAALLVAQHIAGPLSGKVVAVVGASNIVGLPLAVLLIREGATVRIAQHTTGDLAAQTRDADIVISATGVPGLIGAAHIRPRAILLDVGVTRVAGKLVGDVDQASVTGKASVITHVPDGVGPVTAACLFENIVTLLQTPGHD